VVPTHHKVANTYSQHLISPLYLASGKGHSERLTILLQHGADVHCLNKNGISFLHLAAIQGHSEVLKILLQHGADVHCSTKMGTVPYMWLLSMVTVKY
jgi:ankyrin repeat protein